MLRDLYSRLVGRVRMRLRLIAWRRRHPALRRLSPRAQETLALAWAAHR